MYPGQRIKRYYFGGAHECCDDERRAFVDKRSGGCPYGWALAQCR